MEIILNEIDKRIQDTFPNKGLKAYGYCEVVKKLEETKPVTCQRDKKGNREVAEIHDRYNGIFYHRLLNSTWSDDESFSFGYKMSKRQRKRIRTVIAYKTVLGEEFINDFIAAIPDTITLTGFKLVDLREGTLIADHEAIYNQEYGQGSYEKHRITWNIFALEYDIEFILC